MLQYNPTVSGSLTITGSLTVTNGVIGTVSGVDIQIFSSSINQVITGIQVSTGSSDAKFQTLSQVTSSALTRLTNIESKSASVDISISNINSVTSSFSPRVSNLESKSASVDISISNINSFTSSNANTSLNSKTGSYATTGSNTFVGTTIMSGSTYVQGDLIVLGSSSIQYISASSVSIGTNIVQLNTSQPAVRFGGLSVQDSGSAAGVTGSMFWDGCCNRWIYSNPSGVGYSGGVLMSGPRGSTLGNEPTLTCNYIAKSGGGDHLYDSCIIDDGTTVCVNANLKGSGTACFANTVCLPRIENLGVVNTYMDFTNGTITICRPTNGTILNSTNLSTLSNIGASTCIVSCAGSGGSSLYVGNNGSGASITTNCSIGINTTTPNSYLHIEAANNTTNQFRVNSCDGLNAGLKSYTTSDCSGLIINHYYAVSGNPYLRTSDFVSNQGDSAATQMRFFTKVFSANAALAMIISSGGCVGINTSSPNSLLEVQNCINLPYLNTNALSSGQWLRVSNASSCTGSTSGILFQAQGPGGGNGLATINGSVVSCGSMSLTFATRDSSGNVEEKMRIVSSGTVAIGTQTATPLPHAGAGVGGLIVQGLAGNRGLIEVWDATSGKGIFQQVGGTTYIGNLCKGASGGDLRFLINGIGPSATEAMVITCAGRILINNSAQNGCADYSRMTISSVYAKTNTCLSNLASVLHLTTCENDYPFGAKFFIGGDTCSTNRFLSIQTGDHNISNQGNIILQQSGGKVGIGTTTPGRLLEVNGDVTLGGNNYIASNKMIQWEGGAYYSLRTISSGQTFQVYRGDTGLSPLQILNNGTAQYYGDFSGGNYYTADTTPSMCMLAPGQCINFCYMSGMLVVNDWNNGSTTLYLAGGGSTTMVANAVSQTGCFWYNPGVVGYSWSNTSGATRCYGFFVVRTRPNA